jgi:hypothetical protein
MFSWGWSNLPARQRMWHAVAAFAGGLVVVGWAVLDFHGLTDGPFGWLLLILWPFAMPFFIFQFIRARRELREEARG